ncbi:LutC/YkgG family protein [Roseospira marina]|uniref:LutC/YkgG family protein n=1 Tax=Roseospira marina TaxID=140057 RepID=UPI0016099409|nr:lactate utilization protein C [Roseospira marina]MBB4315663.1 L-lactate dehydrogenase complex protein LldG [Roseospira marina]MBB5088721.1 L-lactate dehydrogenase complex protein LldG [Roseospira marina]
MADSSRETVLNGIRTALRRGPVSESVRRELDGRLADHPASVVPSIARGGRDALVARFIAQAEASAATVARVAPDGVAAAVADLVRRHNLPARVAVAADPRLDDLDADGVLTVDRRGTPAPDDLVGVSHAVAGIAETGTLMMASGPASPSTLNMLPDTHIVVVRATDVAGGLEDAWDRLRALSTDGLPRTVHFITGPSRTGDIEQTLQLGAHGPRRLHVILVDDGPDALGQ